MTQPAQTSLSRLEEIVGGAHVLTDAAELDARRTDGMRPSAVVRPHDAAQIAEIIRFAAMEKLAVIPCGGCSKLGIGSPPARYDIALDLTRMNRILAYDPRDLTLGVEPGARIEDLLRSLAEQRQFLPLAVPFSDRATIGGIVAANSSSPLRHAYGGVRDFCLGMEFVTGEGGIAKSGGRVVKNVTGYDLHKLLIGSLGTLAVITRVNFRTFPLPSGTGDVCRFIFRRRSCFRILPFDRPIGSHAADSGGCRSRDCAYCFLAETPARITARQWSVIVAAVGQSSVVDRYARDLGRLASAAGADEFGRLGDEERDSTLAGVREFPRLILDAAPSALIFRIALRPTVMAALVTRLGQLAAQYQLDFAALTRASGVAYVAFLSKEGEIASCASLAKLSGEVFRACGNPEIDANAMLEWCPTEVKRAMGGVGGPTRRDFTLMQRVKNAFDPQYVLSPGRFAGEA